MRAVICLVSSGKGTWGEVYKILSKEDWDKVFIVTNEFGKDKFDSKNAEIIECDFNKSIEEIRDNIITKIKNKVTDTEIGINISSGNGKEHIALISAVLKSGLGPRFIYYNEKTDKVEEA